MRKLNTSFTQLGMAAAAAIPLFFASGCHDSSRSDDWLWILLVGGYPSTGARTQPQPYYGWYDRFGYRCGALGPGCNYYSNGYKIEVEEDPYYYSSSGWYYYYSYYYGAYVNESPSGVLYDDWTGQALNEGNEVSDGFDVITDVALANKKRAQAAGHYFAQKFSLSEDQGARVAKTLNDFVMLKKRTTQDMADFTQRLYGVDFGKVLSAVDELKAGNQAGMSELIDTAAGTLNATPEATKELIQELHGHLLKEQGIDLSL